MRFWDSSAIVPLLAREATSTMLRQLLDRDPVMTVWCLTRVEAWSAISRKRRDRAILSPEYRAARQRLVDLRGSWSEVSEVAAVCDRAERLAETGPLRAADAMQLAAALVLVGDQPRGLSFVTLDEELREAAARKGFDTQLA